MTDNRRLVDWSAVGRAAMDSLIVGFVRGIRGPRKNPVSLKTIERWFRATPKPFISERMNELVGAGVIRIVRNGPRTGHSHQQGYSYEVAQ